jgi:hypothetical protein
MYKYIYHLLFSGMRVLLLLVVVHVFAYESSVFTRMIGMNIEMRWNTTEINPLVNFQVTYPSSTVWCALGWNLNPVMPNTQAAVCQGGNFKMVFAAGKVAPAKITDYLRGSACLFDTVNDLTTMTFARRFTENAPNSLNFSNRFYLIAAVGDSSQFTRHALKAYSRSPSKSPTIRTLAPSTAIITSTLPPTIVRNSLFSADLPVNANVETVSGSTVRFTIQCPSPNWCAFGMNKKQAKMDGMEAVICVEGMVKVYQGNGYSVPSDTGLRQYLITTSCIHSSNSTIMTFTRPIILSRNVGNTNSVNCSASDTSFFLIAYGISSKLTAHRSQYVSYGSIFDGIKSSNGLSGDDKGSNAGLIAGISVPLILISLLLVAYFLKRQKSKMYTSGPSSIQI